MIDLDFDKLAIGVEERLDEIFADELQSSNPKIVKFKYAKPPSLTSLRNIIMSLEWEVTDDHLNDLMQELSKLHRAYKKDGQCQKLLRILFMLGRYVRVYQSDTHPYVFKMITRAFKVLAKIASGKYSDHRKARLVNEEVKRYFSLKAYLKFKNNRIQERSTNKLNTLEKSRLSSIGPYSKQKSYQTGHLVKIDLRDLNKNFREMKKLIYTEMKKLREDLHRIFSLIHIET